MTRRDFLTLSLAVTASTVFAGEEKKILNDNRALWLIRGKKELYVEYVKNGQLILPAYKNLCFFFKDEQLNEAVTMDLALFDVMHRSQAWSMAHNINSPIILTSGYRTDLTNILENGARNSMHKYGKAGDLRKKEFDNYIYALLLRKMGGNGIGIYKTHVHVDTWHKRSWLG